MLLFGYNTSTNTCPSLSKYDTHVSRGAQAVQVDVGRMLAL
jgi:hypothetical protein